MASGRLFPLLGVASIRGRALRADDDDPGKPPVVVLSHSLWQRRFGVAPRDDRDKARQVRFLQARGYPLAIALAVLRRAGVNDADEPS